MLYSLGAAFSVSVLQSDLSSRTGGSLPCESAELASRRPGGEGRGDYIGQRTDDAYELEDLAQPAGRRRIETRQQREEKSIEQLRTLTEEEEMKFSHSIQFNAVPDWSNHYIAYSNLKKL